MGTVEHKRGRRAEHKWRGRRMREVLNLNISELVP